LTSDSSQNPGVTSLAISITIWGGLEQGMDQVFVIDPGHGLATGVQVTPLSQLDHVINVLSDGLGTNQGGLDASVSDNFSSEGTQQSLALIGRLTQLVKTVTVTRHFEAGFAGGGWCECRSWLQGSNGGTSSKGADWKKQPRE
jgi:hypothetical protein